MNENDTMQIHDPGLSHPRKKPLLRGYLHLSAAVASAVGTGILLYLASGDADKQVTLAIYGISSVILFGWSALYHIPFWSERVRPFLRRVDHANIFLLIAGTYTPIVHNLLRDGWRIGILTAAWVVAGLGIALAAMAARVPRWVMAGLYVLAGWIVVIAMPRIVEAVSTGGIVLLLSAGITYTLGALVYASKRPRLWPRIFGYHEAFHLATIAANATFFAFMLIYVIPAGAAEAEDVRVQRRSTRQSASFSAGTTQQSLTVCAPSDRPGGSVQAAAWVSPTTTGRSRKDPLHCATRRF